MSHLDEYLGYYKDLESPGYAVLVTGDWGTGKTYQVKKCIPVEDRMYVSLFGVQTIEQLHSEVFVAYAPKMAKFEKLAERCADFVARVGGVFSIARGIPSVCNAVFKQKIGNDKMLVFDDLERSNLDPKEVLGAINYYVEHKNCRVVVVAHDEKLSNEFLQVKEKIFGHSIRVEPQVEDALDHFIQGIHDVSTREFIENQKVNISKIFVLSGIKSLRILRDAISNLVRLYDALSAEHRNNMDAMADVLNLFVALQFEVRSGNILKNDLQRRHGTSIRYVMRNIGRNATSFDTLPLITAGKKYQGINLEDQLLNDDILCGMLFDGRFPKKEIQASVAGSHYFMDPDDVPSWMTIMWYAIHDDEVVEKAIRKMDQQFRDREITDSGELLHIFGLRMMLAEKNIIEKCPEAVVAENNEYIDELLEMGSLPSRGTDYNWRDEFKHSYGGFAYWRSTNRKYSDCFDDTYERLMNAREKAFHRTLPEIQTKLLAKVKDDPDGFCGDLSPAHHGQYANIAVLHGICPVKFVNAWLETPVRSWPKITSALVHRYNSRPIELDLAEEKVWMLNVSDELNLRATKESGLRACRIRELRPNAQLGIEQARAEAKREAIPENVTEK